MVIIEWPNYTQAWLIFQQLFFNLDTVALAVYIFTRACLHSTFYTLGIAMFGQNLLNNLKKDFPASIVVFLVALPLCLGIAIASGVPPALGLVTGIIGGIVVGLLTGSPLQVSGPAAGLTVIVYTIVQNYGLKGLGLAVFLAGSIQVIAGIAGIGRWFKAISPAVIYGMLAGIGLIIISSQIHIMLDTAPLASPIQNYLALPSSLIEIFANGHGFLGSPHQHAAAIGLITIVTLVMWDKYRPQSLHALPGALVAVVLATVLASAWSMPVSKINIPANIVDSFTFLNASALSFLKDAQFIDEVIGLAVIASAETLLCASAIDKMQVETHTKYNKELAAQGIGNMLCGVIGALPMTGVIVRSSANVEAGAKTQLSAILHGIWILILVLSFSFILKHIPSSSLAAILVYTGYKLINVAAIKKMLKYGNSEIIIYGVTVGGIIFVDLLFGVLAGFILSLLKILVTMSYVKFIIDEQDSHIDIHFKGAATLVTLPKITDQLEELLHHNKSLTIHFDNLYYIDHACADYLESMGQRFKSRGLRMNIDHEKLQPKIHRVHT